MNFKRVSVLIFALLFITAYGSNIYLVSSFDYDLFNEVTEGIKKELKSYKIIDLRMDNDKLEIVDKKENICFAIGEKALNYLKENTKNIRVVALVVYDIEKYSFEPERIIYVEPKIDSYRKILILKAILSDIKGVIIPCSRQWYEKNSDDYVRTMKKEGIDLQFKIIKKDLGRVLLNLNIPKDYVVMAVYDSSIYTPENTYNILKLTYKRGIPFIGLTKGFVKCGAYLSIIPDYYSMGIETVKAVKRGIKKGEVNNIKIKNYKVFVNYHIIKSFNFSINTAEGNITFLK